MLGFRVPPSAVFTPEGGRDVEIHIDPPRSCRQHRRHTGRGCTANRRPGRNRARSDLRVDRALQGSSVRLMLQRIRRLSVFETNLADLCQTRSARKCGRTLPSKFPRVVFISVGRVHMNKSRSAGACSLQRATRDSHVISRARHDQALAGIPSPDPAGM